VITIARLTIHEAARRRILWVLVALTLLSVGLTGWATERLASLARNGGVSEIQIQVGVSQVLILTAFMFSFVLAMTAAFLAAPAIAADLESGVALALLARPIRRADLVVGRWLGLSIVIAAYSTGSGLLEIGVVAVLTGHAPPEPFEAVAFLAFQSIVLLTTALLLSTRLPAIAAGAICVVMFGLGWMAGVFAGIGRFFAVDVLVTLAQASRWLFPSDGLWRGVIHGLEPPLVVLGASRLGSAADANPFYAPTPPPVDFIAWAIAWIALVLGLAVVSLERREI
jgi:ABC-type transport system involved in multi-copper enzyme maturation permease subunit